MTLRLTSATLLAALISVLVSPSTYAADFSAPLIDLPRVKQPASSDSAVIVEAIVDDDVGVSSVKLFYRLLDQSGNFTSVPLKRSKKTPKTYTVTLPAATSKQRGIEYYVEARDVASNVTQEPFPNNPRKVIFQFTSTANAEPSTNSLLFGKNAIWSANLSYGIFSVNDPNGDTGAIYTPSFGGSVNFPLTQKWRGETNLNYLSFTLPYSETNIGQDVTSLRIEFLVQRHFRINHSPAWIGAGVGVEKSSNTNVGTELNNTFLVRYTDRNSTSLGIAFDFGYQLGMIGSNVIGLNGKVYTSLDDGVGGFMAGIYLSF